MNYAELYQLAIRTAEGVKPLSFNVFDISWREYVLLLVSCRSASSTQIKAHRGNVDAKVTVSTLYARFSEATHSATSIRATVSQCPCTPGQNALLSLGKVFVNGAPPTLRRTYRQPHFLPEPLPHSLATLSPGSPSSSPPLSA